jgi:hypothetical protein
MENKVIKGMILSRIDKLNTQWSEVVDTEERTTPMDYMRVAEIQGAINALMALMVEIDSIKASE